MHQITLCYKIHLIKLSFSHYFTHEKSKEYMERKCLSYRTQSRTKFKTETLWPVSNYTNISTKKKEYFPLFQKFPIVNTGMEKFRGREIGNASL